MSGKDWRECAKEMITLCQKVISVTKDLDYDEFVAHPEVCEIVAQNAQQLGLAAYDLPEAIFEFYPKVDWKALIAVGYLCDEADELYEVIQGLMWPVVKDTIPALLPILHHLLQGAERERSGKGLRERKIMKKIDFFEAGR